MKLIFNSGNIHQEEPGLEDNAYDFRQNKIIQLN